MKQEIKLYKGLNLEKKNKDSIHISFLALLKYLSTRCQKFSLSYIKDGFVIRIKKAYIVNKNGRRKKIGSTLYYNNKTNEITSWTNNEIIIDLYLNFIDKINKNSTISSDWSDEAYRKENTCTIQNLI